MPELFRNCGKALMMASGGASGVIFGTLFQGAGKALTRDAFDAEALVAALEGGLKAVQERGKAKVGDKTMVDALAPAAEAARSALKDGASLEAGRRGGGEGRRGGAQRRRKDWSQSSASQRGWANERWGSSIRAR